MTAPDAINAAFEFGSACFGTLNIRAIRRDKKISGVHWGPTAFFFVWGIWNLYFYRVVDAPISYWAGILITLINLTWLAHVGYYSTGKGSST